MIGVGSIVNGKYRIVRILGDGGMGSVYEAHHAVLGTRVAIKVLHAELMRRNGLVERFLQEARVVAQIRSTNVVQVMDVDRTPEGHAFIVMELLEGEALSAALDRQRRLAVPVACGFAVQILSALEAAHSLGVIHRDLKPENVIVTMVAGRPVLKLIDFGIAKARRTEPSQRNLTVAGAVMGTAEYMAPEQARSAESVDARADLYAVGVMLYEMIAGTRPVRGDAGEDARVIALKVERGEVVPLVQAAPGAPRELAGLVHRAMAARPEMRFGSATQMRQAIESLSEVSVPRMPSAPPTGSGAGAPSEPRVDTVRAPPLATALVGPSYSGSGPYSPAAAGIPAGDSFARQPRGPSGAGRTVAMAGLAALFLASVGGILVGTGVFSTSGHGPEVAVTDPPAPSQGAALEVPSTMPAASTQSDVPTLVSSKTAGVGARPLPSGRGLAPAVTDAGAAAPDPSASAAPPSFNGIPLPAGFPTALPSGFPTALPSGFPTALPAGFPTALPSGFPTALPSGFPSVLPAWPAPPASSASSARSSRTTPAPAPTEF